IGPSLTHIDVRYEDLIDLLGKRLNLEECVDRITYMGAGPEGVQGHVMAFEVFPNRPDLYSVEGIARGLRGCLGLEKGLTISPVRAAGLDFIVERSVADVRPFAVGGIVRDLELDDDLLRSIVDLQGKLLSFPPAINGILTQLRLDTRNLFLDVTGTDLEAVSGCLAILATTLAERGVQIELVRTKYADKTLETPDLSPRPHSLDLRHANERLGLSVTPSEAVEFLRRMRPDARPD